MIKCPNCSKEIYESAVRCKHCKTKLFGGNVIAEKQGVVKDEVKVLKVSKKYLKLLKVRKKS